MIEVFTRPSIDTSDIKRKWLDLSYADYSKAQKLDIYLPEAGQGPFPVIVSIHDGGCMDGDKGDILNRPLLEALNHDYAVVFIK
jgi:acetyl esterase/lipase